MAATNVRVERSGDRVAVIAPYNPTFPSQAKAAGGRWDAAARTWSFDARDEERVRELCRAIYGTDGAPVDMATIRHRLTGYDGQSLWLAGREVAHRPGRDAEVRLGEGVVIIEGRFAPSGGSAKNPRLAGDGVMLEIRDVPRFLAERDAEDENTWIVEPVDAKRISLEARLAEIEAEAARIREQLAQL